MKRWFGLMAVLWAVLGALSVRADVPFTVGKLRTYCAACHALGELRFIHSDDDQVVWDYLFQATAPHSKKLWATAILEVLNWPSDSAPPFNQMMTPPNQDWMPKGKKRLTLAADGDARRRMRDDLLSAF